MIRYVKLLGGDELLGKVDGEQSAYDGLCLVDPIRLMLTNKGYMMVPLPTRCITVSQVHVLFEGDVVEAVERDYTQTCDELRQRDSGLAVPKHGLVMSGGVGRL